MKNVSIFLASILFCVAGCTDSKTPVDYVDPMIGTGFHGHTYPGATVPLGAVQLSPDTRSGNWDACAGYHYSDSTLWGFSHTHLSGTGCIDLGDILFRPTTQPVDLNSTDRIYRPARFSHQQETARAGYYKVYLPEEGITAELTATTYAGMHRYTFPEGEQATVIIDLAHSLDNEHIYASEFKVTGNNEIVGMRNTEGWVDNQHIYFVAQFSQPFQEVQLIQSKKPAPNKTTASGTDLQAVIRFKDFGNQPIIAKVGLSTVSADNARENLAHDISGFDFDDVHSAAEKRWKDQLSLVTVEGDNEDDKKIFYTALYHSFVVPNIVSDVNGEYRQHDMTIARTIPGSKQYSTISNWDIFRTWCPLITLVDTTLTQNIVRSFLNVYDITGELPIWPLSSGETFTMIGYHAASIIADAYLKGIRGFDADKALEAMIQSSEKNRKGADYYIKYGYIPSDLKAESISCLLEYAYDDWTIARMAQAMGNQDVYQTYIKRSQNYRNVFDSITNFFRPKTMNGEWDKDFDPLKPHKAYTEATAWQYRFFVPHDVNGMVQLFKGESEFIARLDSLFTTDYAHTSEVPDITGLIGQYAHGNEPSHHIAYLYNYVKQPWKAQAMTQRLLREMYQPTPEGISGNEDCGQMSAWYILSALGIYPVCPGSNEFVLTTPLFEKATIRLANGNQLTILSNASDKNLYIDKVEWNGNVINDNFIRYEQLMKGGVLCFTLSETPNTSRGVLPENAPYSFTK